MSANVAPPLLARIDWTAAACYGDRVSDWTADVPSDRARGLCHGCPIAAQCLAYAIAADEEHGLWGGLDRMEREQYRKTLIRRAGTGEDRVVHYLRRLVIERKQELCPRCRRHWMSAGSRWCVVCAEAVDETTRARKREYFRTRFDSGRDEVPPPGTVSAVDRACTWLRVELRDGGPQDSSALKAKAANAGITSTTLGRARERLGVVVKVEYRGKDGRQSTWMLERDADRETEQATCEECGAPFIRDVVRGPGRPQRLCSDRCRTARDRRNKQARDGRTYDELHDRMRGSHGGAP